MASGLWAFCACFPTGLSGVGVGHVFALLAALSGTFSMIMARYIGRYETNALAQVFYPNLALFCRWLWFLPFVWVQMALTDAALVVLYAAFLFAARWLCVLALRLLPAYAVTPLMNLQFVWMVGLGAAVFGEVPSSHLLLGVSIIIGTGLFLVWDQFRYKACEVCGVFDHSRHVRLQPSHGRSPSAAG